MVKQTPIVAEHSSSVISRPHVEIIDTFSGFEGLRPEWDRLMQKDPQAHIFLSWDWLAKAFRDNPLRWSVIAVRATEGARDLLCLLPLKYRTHWSNNHNAFHTEIESGGRLLWSEYTGFLCDPEHEETGLTAAATALAALPWSQLSMRYVPQQERAEIFTKAFKADDFRITWKDYMINKGETDNLICPVAYLPEDFESYLTTSISANSRQKYRRFARRLEAGEFQFTHSGKSNFQGDLDILLGFWMDKWAKSKGTSSARKVAENYRQVLTAAHGMDTLFLPVLWQGDQPVGALGHVLDPHNGQVHFIVAGRDTKSKDPFIGSALHFHAIETAIESGYESYDFCHGNEKYKYSYGVEDKKVAYFSIRRRATELAKNFDSISSGEALNRVVQFLDQGRIDKAKSACKQISQLLS